LACVSEQEGGDGKGLGLPSSLRSIGLIGGVEFIEEVKEERK
jgi:hypothetical protein